MPLPSKLALVVHGSRDPRLPEVERAEGELGDDQHADRGEQREQHAMRRHGLSADVRPGASASRAKSAESANDERKPRVTTLSSVVIRSSRIARSFSSVVAPRSSNGSRQIRDLALLGLVERVAEVERDRHLLPQRRCRPRARPARQRAAPCRRCPRASWRAAARSSASASTRPACRAPTVIEAAPRGATLADREPRR